MPRLTVDFCTHLSNGAAEIVLRLTKFEVGEIVNGFLNLNTDPDFERFLIWEKEHLFE